MAIHGNIIIDEKQIFPTKKEGAIKAFAIVTVNCPVQMKVKLVQNKDGSYFTTCPDEKAADGKWYPHTIIQDPFTREQLTAALREGLKNKLESAVASAGSAVDTGSKRANK